MFVLCSCCVCVVFVLVEFVLVVPPLPFPYAYAAHRILGAPRERPIPVVEGREVGKGGRGPERTMIFYAL